MVSTLLLVGATALSFIAIMYVVPAYFSSYLAMGTDAASSVQLFGVSTDGHLKRVGSRLVVFIFNHGDSPVTVSYTVYCLQAGTSTTVGGESGVLIGRSSLFTKVYSPAPTGVCFLVVEEPNAITYKVVES